MDYTTKLVLSQYWRDIGGHCADCLNDAMSSGDYSRVVKILNSVAPRRWQDPYRFRRARLAVDIIKKADYLPIDIDREAACVETWVKAEKLCRNQNRLVTLISLGNHSSIEPSTERLIRKARRFIRRVIGECPDVENLDCEFGPGATLSNTRSKSAVVYKLQQTAPTITDEARWFIPALPIHARRVWHDCENATLVVANRFETVPKTWKTLRGIAVEPLVNAFIQRALGKQLSERLLRFGIDTQYAPKTHEKLALQGSLTGEWATIDLSCASDTLSKELVKFMLPYDWWRTLDYARCKYTDVSSVVDKHPALFRQLRLKDDGLVELEKFSSMGNGATFELETLIFFALCTAVVGDHRLVRTFGDDIIVPSASAKNVIRLLTQLGFVINEDKSFITGPFRESCGGDFMSGVAVKGVTLKTEPKCANDWYTLHNRLWCLSRDYNLELSRTLHVIRNQVPKHLRLDIPEGLSGGFFSESPRPKVKDGMYYYKVYIPAPRFQTLENFQPEIILAAALLSKLIGRTRDFLTEDPKPFEAFGIEPKSYRCKWVPYS